MVLGADLAGTVRDDGPGAARFAPGDRSRRGRELAFSEGLSDTGDLTGRGNPVLRGAITGGGTFAGGIFHTLPFLIPGYGPAISAAIIVVAGELLTLAWLRHKFFQTSFARSFAVTVGGAIIASLSAALGVLAAA